MVVLTPVFLSFLCLKVNVSSDSESDVAEDIQIVGYVKPRHERTPEIITLSSPEHPGRSTPPSTSQARGSSSSVNLNNDPICIRLGNNTSAELKWHDGHLNVRTFWHFFLTCGIVLNK